MDDKIEQGNPAIDRQTPVKELSFPSIADRISKRIPSIQRVNSSEGRIGDIEKGEYREDAVLLHGPGRGVAVDVGAPEQEEEGDGGQADTQEYFLRSAAGLSKRRPAGTRSA